MRKLLQPSDEIILEQQLMEYSFSQKFIIKFYDSYYNLLLIFLNEILSSLDYLQYRIERIFIYIFDNVSIVYVVYVII